MILVLSHTNCVSATLRCTFLASLWIMVLSTASTPEISSTVLQMHKLYTGIMPHDFKLYDTLQVSPNATAAQITKNYRKLSRELHPDKVAGMGGRLHAVQQAYEILKDDSTRLPYHKYGMADPNVAVALLLGPRGNQNHLLDSAHLELLELIGYENDIHMDPVSSMDATSRQKSRVTFLAARLVERLRPLVEGSVDPHLVAYELARECDDWKRLPLGAQVIRCVGRAYRHAGNDFLQGKKDPTVSIRQQWRQAKAFWTAFLATGKATVTEQVWTHQEKSRQRQRRKERLRQKTTPGISEVDRHSNIGSLSFEEDLADFSDEDEEEMRFVEQFKAKQTLLTTMQVDALWKVAKIDLDRTVRKACEHILSGRYFFFPSYHDAHTHGDGYHETPSNGWVSVHGRIIHTEEALLKAAQAMIFLGDVMVERSKVDTTWPG